MKAADGGSSNLKTRSEYALGMGLSREWDGPVTARDPVAPCSKSLYETGTEGIREGEAPAEPRPPRSVGACPHSLSPSKSFVMSFRTV